MYDGRIEATLPFRLVVNEKDNTEGRAVKTRWSDTTAEQKRECHIDSGVASELQKRPGSTDVDLLY